MWSGLVRVALPALTLVGLLFLPLVTLWPALSGPFLFDDNLNLDALRVLEGEVTRSGLANYLAEKSAGPTGRPLSMLSFLLNDVYWPSEPWSFKYTNLLIHIINGLLLAWLVLVIVRQWAGQLDQRHIVLSLLVAAFWVLNPYQLSSVMYVVQRMALLSSLFVLSGLLLYLAGRRFLAAGESAKGYGLIWSGYLVGAGIGVLCKENAALFVLMVPLFEWLLFPARASGQPRPVLLKATLGLPALAMLMVLGSYFFSTHGYEWFRDFTLSERLLSQGRALGYYLWRYLIPGVGYVGLYADGFEKSVSLLQPVSTLIWMIVHALIIASAIFYARRLPLLSLGVLFFYVAHSMESGAIALELFFEHRNYLPSVLLLLGVLHIPRQKVAILTMVLVVLSCAALQYLQATFWGDERHLNTIMVMENPDSERALVVYANYLERQGDFVDSLVVMKSYVEQHPYGMDIALNVVKMACFLGIDSEQDAVMLEASTAKYRGKAEPVVRQIGDIARWVHEGKCKSITFVHLERFLDSYMRAYPRDSEATQAHHVARSYLDYYRGDYSGFHTHMTAALDVHPNLPLAYSACSKFAALGGVEQGCECFRKYEYLLGDRAIQKPTLTQRLLDRVDGLTAGFKAEAEAVCAAAGNRG
ncbi:MAG: hypothetical protein ACK4SX_09865 [Alcanivoracaceae bacterium]